MSMNSALPPLYGTGVRKTIGDKAGDEDFIPTNSIAQKPPRFPLLNNRHGDTIQAIPSQSAEVITDLRATHIAPVRYALIYWIATFVIFLFSNLVSEVRNLTALITFVSACFTLFYVGYRIGIARYPLRHTRAVIPAFGRSGIDIALIVAGSAYFFLWGINQMVEFDLTNPLVIAQALLSPGEAYKAKFEIAQTRIDSSYSSTLGQILVLTSLLYAVFVPLFVVAWRNLSLKVRWMGLTGIIFYVISFLAIGTLKGLGDVVLFVIAGSAVAIAKRRLAGGAKVTQGRIYANLALIGVSFAIYMMVSQVQRAEQFQIIESPIVGDVSQTFIAKQFGHETAYGFYTMMAYPSHGYAGLAFNLEQPFVFSRGAGISLAFESYRQQYLGSGDNRFLTFPFRTQMATGWDAQMFWSTALPWLASDVSFFGVPFLLALIGFLYARVWLASLYGKNPLALGGLALTVMFIAFMPANNQVLLSRQGLWSVVTLSAFSLLLVLVRSGRQRQ